MELDTSSFCFEAFVRFASGDKLNADRAKSSKVVNARSKGEMASDDGLEPRMVEPLGKLK